MSFTALWQQNGSFQTPQCCQFSNRSLFRSLPRVMNLGNDRKNISDILRCKHQRWDFYEESTVWQSDVPRLDWVRARNKFSDSIFETAVRCFGSKYTHLRQKTSDIVATFRRPSIIRRPGHCAPSLRPWCDTRDKVRSCEICRALNVETLLLIERTQLH